MAVAYTRKAYEVMGGLGRESGEIGQIIYVGSHASARAWTEEHFTPVLDSAPSSRFFAPKGVTEPLPYVLFEIHVTDSVGRDPGRFARMLDHPDRRFFLYEGSALVDWDDSFVQYKCLPWIKTLATDVCLNTGRAFLEAQADYAKLVLQLCSGMPLEATFVTNREEIFQCWMWAYGTSKRSVMPATGMTAVPPPFERESPVMRNVYKLLGRPMRLDMGRSYDPREFFTSSSGHKADLVTMPADLRPPGAGRPAAELLDLDGDVADTDAPIPGTGPTHAARAMQAHLAEIDKILGLLPGDSRIDKLYELKRLAAIGRQFRDTLAEIEEYRDELEGRVADLADYDDSGFTHTFRPSSDGPFMTMTTVSEDGTTTRSDLSEFVSEVTVVREPDGSVTLDPFTFDKETTFGKMPIEPIEPIEVTTISDAASGHRTFVSPYTGIVTKRIIDPLD